MDAILATIVASRQALGGVVPSNPRRWRGERLHCHGGGVCSLLVLLWMDSWCHELIVCKKWYKNNLKMRLPVLLFDALMRAPHLQHQIGSFAIGVPPHPHIFCHLHFCGWICLACNVEMCRPSQHNHQPYTPSFQRHVEVLATERQKMGCGNNAHWGKGNSVVKPHYQAPCPKTMENRSPIV